MDVNSDFKELILSLTRISVMALAFVTALYSFFEKEPKLKESGSKLLTVIFLFGVSSIFCILSIFFYSYPNLCVARYMLQFGIIIFAFGWIVFLASFWKLYGRIYHLREKRFWKYVFPFSIGYRLLSRKYALTMRERASFVFAPFQLSDALTQSILNGYTFLFLSQSEVVNLARLKAFELIINGLGQGETADYVTCEIHPYLIWQDMEKHFPQVHNHINHVTMIDVYSPNYSFNDEILEEKSKEICVMPGGEGLMIYEAKTIAGIHSAINTSWYKSKKQLKNQGPQIRRPHRMVYDKLSSLAKFSGVEEIEKYFYHSLSAEKGYRMITIIVESSDAPESLKNSLIRLVDCVVNFSIDDNNIVSMHITKMSGAQLSYYSEKYDLILY